MTTFGDEIYEAVYKTRCPFCGEWVPHCFEGWWGHYIIFHVGNPNPAHFREPKGPTKLPQYGGPMPGEVAERRPYDCLLCGAQFDSEDELKTHLADEHYIAYP